MKKITLTLMALFLVASVATAAMAYGPGRGSGRGASAPCDARGFSALNLSEEQKTKLNASQEAHWKEVAPLREQMTAKRDALQKLWLEPNPDQAKIAAAQKELRTLRDQMQDKGTAFRLEQLKVLTDILSSLPEAQALKDRLEQWLAVKEHKDNAAACQCS